MVIILFRLLNRLLEIICIPLYPIIYLVLRANNYLEAMSVKATNSEKGILIHAASVGEVNAVRPLVSSLQKEYPKLKIVMTTTTLSGMKVAKSLGIPAHLAVLDLSWLRKRQLRNIDPKLIIIVETEIWFNLLDQAYLQGRNVVFVNARLSGKSLATFSKIKPLLKPLQRPIKAIYCQTEPNAERFKKVFDVPIYTAGNLKYATQYPVYSKQELRAKYGYSAEDFIICLGSSRPGEEALLASILPELREQIPNLKIVIALRHPKRIYEVQSLFADYALYSSLHTQTDKANDVLLVDTIGHLNEFYSFCEIAIVGGSLYDFGGHNPLEPAFYGKPVVMGDNHHSCSGSVADLQRHNAILITSAQNLNSDLVSLYKNPDKREELGKNARVCLRDGSQSLEKHMQGLREWLK